MKMSVVQEIRLDVEELKGLIEKSTRSNVKEFLHTEVKRLESEIHRRAVEKVEGSSKPVEGPVAKTQSCAPGLVPRIKIDLYAYGQSDKFVNLYVSDKLKDLKDLPAENFTSSFTERGVHLEVKNLKGRDYFFDIVNLLHPIIPEQSNHKVKPDSIVLNLRKKDTNDWECITSAEKALKDKKTKKEKLDMDTDSKADPQASIMNMMKKMYADGDDDMKRTISKAWFESSQKQGKGMPGGPGDMMGGMGGMGLE